MEKIELNKRTLRTLSASEVSLVAGGDAEDGDEMGPKDPKNTIASECPCPTEIVVCPPLSQNCPPTNDLKCCPKGSD